MVAGEDTATLIQQVLHFDDLPEWMQTDPFIRHGYRCELKSFRECCWSLFYPHNEFVNTWSHLLPALFFLTLLLVADYPVLYAPAQVSWIDNLVIQMYVAGTAGCLFLSAFFHGTNAHSEEVARRFLKLDYLGIVLTISTTCVSASYFGLYGSTCLQTLYITLTIVCAAAVFRAVLRSDADGHSAAAWRAVVFIALALSGFMPVAHVALAEGAEGLGRYPLANIAVTCGSYLVGTAFYIYRVPEKHFPGCFDIWVDSLPYRFKSGGGMAPLPDHHHRSTTKVSHKSFKSKHSTKGLLKERSKGKIDGEGRHRKSPHQQLMSKLDRRNQARQKQQAKHQENARATSIFSGQHGAPRIVAVVPLCPDGDARAAVRQLNTSLGSENEVPTEGLARVRVDRFKQNLMYVPVERDLTSVLDACRVADFVIVILSPVQEVDKEGELFLRCIEGQGVSNVITVVQGLDAIDPSKRRQQVASSLKSFITHFFPSQEKVFSLDSLQECSNIVRSLCTTTPKGIRWREDRSWMLAEDVQWPTDIGNTSDQVGEVIITGVVRGKGLKADRLVHLGDLGEFQIEKIVASPLPKNKKRQANEIDADVELDILESLEQPTADQDDMAELAPEEVLMADADDLAVSEATTEKKGVLLDDHHYFSDDETHLPEAPKRLPKGTSSYQAAWFLGDMSDSGSDVDEAEGPDGDISMDQPLGPEDGVEGFDHRTNGAPTEGAPSEYPQSEMFLDPSPDEEEEQLAAYRSRRKNEAEEDLEFPDEIELHPNVLARERLARYRGLKSLKTSHWETNEDRSHEPEEWRRLLQITNYKGTKSQVVREALVGGVPPGTRVDIHLRDVPLSLRSSLNLSRPLAVYSLLRHEHKRTVVNCSFTLSSDYPQPIKSKEELIMQCGPRRFIINPIFSQLGNTPNNVHKFDRYVHPGRTAMATFTAPLTWGSVPTLFFKRIPPSADSENIQPPETPESTSGLELIGTGTSQPPDHSRVIAKRVILTGHPYKIHKKLVTVRYMFFNAEDVNWFKALQLWTRRGRSGYIKESLGTHGYFKATFDGKINPQDAVGVSLYKRVFPRSARAWRSERGDVV